MVFSSHFKESISCLKSMNRAPWNLLRVGTFCLHGSIHKKFSFKFYRKTCFLITFPQLVVLINFIHHLFPFHSKVIYIIRIFVNLLLSKNTNFSKKKGKKKYVRQISTTTWKRSVLDVLKKKFTSTWNFAYLHWI